MSGVMTLEGAERERTRTLNTFKTSKTVRPSHVTGTDPSRRRPYAAGVTTSCLRPHLNRPPSCDSTPRWTTPFRSCPLAGTTMPPRTPPPSGVRSSSPARPRSRSRSDRRPSAHRSARLSTPVHPAFFISLGGLGSLLNQPIDRLLVASPCADMHAVASQYIKKSKVAILDGAG